MRHAGVPLEEAAARALPEPTDGGHGLIALGASGPPAMPFNSEVLYRGIAARAFERIFQLADFVQVKNASLENGLLHVDLVREIPEAKKPRNIPIAASEKASLVVDGSAGKVAA